MVPQAGVVEQAVELCESTSRSTDDKLSLQRILTRQKAIDKEQTLNRSASNNRIRYAAEIKQVREVALHGTADFAFWSAMLHPEALVPYNAQGKAELVVSATALRWKGFKFRELIITVSVGADHNPARHGGFYLAHAFNSSSILAYSERVFFKTPYHHGQIRVQQQAPALIELGSQESPRFKAQMAVPKAPSAIRDEAWNGPVFLPKKMTKTSALGHKFFVKLSGEQQIYPFSSASDQITIKPDREHEIFQSLIDSNFTATEWRIRSNAEHAKSKTYPRAFDVNSGSAVE
jgi:hypothetical protein